MPLIAYKLTGTNYREIDLPGTTLFVANMTPGDEIELARDPKNEHDDCAIRVYAHDPDQDGSIRDIGFIGRPHNKKLAKLMDADPYITWHGKFGYLGSGRSKIPAIQVEVPDDD